MELVGISKFWKTKVITKRAVTSTVAEEARNSTSVSRGFSSFLISFLATKQSSYRAKRTLPDYPECAVPTCELKQMSNGIGGVKKFITHRGRSGQVVGPISHRPIDD